MSRESSSALIMGVIAFQVGNLMGSLQHASRYVDLRDVNHDGIPEIIIYSVLNKKTFYLAPDGSYSQNPTRTQTR